MCWRRVCQLAVTLSKSLSDTLRWMDQQAAKAEVLKRWRALPIAKRRGFREALAFGEELGREIEFESLGDRRKMITAWLIRDLHSVGVFR